MDGSTALHQVWGCCHPLRLAGAIATAVVLCLPASASATEWFVAVGGTGPGSVDSPLGSIQAGLNAAQPGDTVVVTPGTYAELLRSGRAGATNTPITLRARDGPTCR